MAWRIEFDRAAERELGKLDPQVASRAVEREEAAAAKG